MDGVGIKLMSECNHMATTLRLSPALEVETRAYCDRVGISLNSLVGVALDAYLRRSDAAQAKEFKTMPTPVSEKPSQLAPTAQAMEKLDGLRESASQNRPVAESRPAPSYGPTFPKPVLSAKPSKAEKELLARWWRENPAK